MARICARLENVSKRPVSQNASRVLNDYMQTEAISTQPCTAQPMRE